MNRHAFRRLPWLLRTMAFLLLITAAGCSDSVPLVPADLGGDDNAGGDIAGGDWAGGDMTAGDTAAGDSAAGDDLMGDQAADACSLCGPAEVCVRGECLTACDQGPCPDGHTCIHEGGLDYCVATSERQIRGAIYGPVQESTSSTYILRGTATHLGGVVEGASLRLSPVIR